MLMQEGEDREPSFDGLARGFLQCIMDIEVSYNVLWTCSLVRRFRVIGKGGVAIGRAFRSSLYPVLLLLITALVIVQSAPPLGADSISEKKEQARQVEQQLNSLQAELNRLTSELNRTQSRIATLQANIGGIRPLAGHSLRTHGGHVQGRKCIGSRRPAGVRRFRDLRQLVRLHVAYRQP